MIHNQHPLFQQFEIDFLGHDLRYPVFALGSYTSDMRLWAKTNGSIVITKGLIYCRLDHEALLNEMKSIYSTCQAQWFGEVSNLKNLESLLNKHGYTIVNYAPFFIPSPRFEPYENENLIFYQPDEILQFKGNKDYDQCFCYDEKHPDLLGVSYTIDGEIVAMAGLNQTGAYTVELGINVLPHAQGKGVGALLVRAITTRANQLYPKKVVTYGTQFTHTQSINVAINAGFTHAWTEIMIERMKID